MSLLERQMPSPAVAAGAVEGRPRQSRSHTLATRAREHWPLLVVFGAFALAALVVPTLAPVATTDDWAYTRSAQILLAEGRLTVFPVVAATALVQIVWGALFGLLFGPTPGVFRLSTVVITGIGAAALYGLCRELGVSRGRAALGVAAYLFNPLVFVLAFTFMTDAHFVALLVMATWLFAKAVGGDAHINGRLILVGSAMSALAFLTRQQGALIVPAVVLFFLLTRQLRFNRAGIVLFVQIVALPMMAIGAYYLWLRYGNAMPQVQGTFFREMLEEGWGGTWWLLRRLTVVELMYFGFFTVPLMAAALPFLPSLARRIPRQGWLLFALWAAVLVAGVVIFWLGGARMPYIPQFFGAGGLGPPDILGSRPRLLTAEMRGGLTAICLGASLMLGLAAARAGDTVPAEAEGTSRANRLERRRAGLVLSIGLWQVIGVLPPSYHYIGWTAGSLDRYLLPLAPLVVALALWGLRDIRLALPVGWTVVILLAIFSVAATRDYLVFMREVWAMGDRALAAGVPLERLDAGSGWDGYHLYEYGLEHRVRSRTPKGGPWWVYFYAPATDSAYVVASKPLAGYSIVIQRPYSIWLARQSPSLYLLRRRGEPWPPGLPPRAIVTRPAPGGLVTVPPPWTGAPSRPLPTVTPRDSLWTGSERDDD